MTGDSFQQELEAMRAGDADAFAAVWRRTQPLLLRYLRALDADHAEDLASETWIDAMRQLPSFSGTEEGFRGWLVTIGRHKFVDQHRRSTRRPERLVDHRDESTGPLSTAPDSAELVVERSATEDAVRLIATLPSDQAEMVALRVIVGLDVAEVAHITGRSPGAVRVAVHRGLRRLAATLAADSSRPGAGESVTAPTGRTLPDHHD